MGVPYICLQCRGSVLGKLRPVFKGQRQLRASSSFISLADTKRDHGNSKEALLDIAGKEYDALPRKLKKNAGVQRGVLPKSAANTGDLLESYFGHEAPNTLRSSNTNATSISPESYVHLETLRKMLATPGKSITDTWDYFLNNLGPRVWAEKKINPELGSFTVIAGRLLRALIRERRSDSSAPTVTQISEIYFSMGMLQNRDWQGMVDELLDELAMLGGKIKQSAAVQNAQGELLYGAHSSLLELTAREGQLIDDLLGAWRSLLVAQSPALHPSLLLDARAQTDWSFLSTTRMPRSNGILEDSFTKVISPRQSVPYHRKRLVSAIRTFELILSVGRPLEGVEIREHPFVKFVASILSNPRYKQDFDRIMQAGQEASNLVDWQNVRRRAKDIRIDTIPYSSVRTSEGASRTKDISGRGSASRAEFTASSLHPKLSNILASRNPSAAHALWRVVSSGKDTQGEGQLDESVPSQGHPLTHEMYNHFITVFMALRQPQAAIEVWNRMIEMSVIPTQATWNAMLEGCKKARDAVGLQAVWNRIMASDIKPDMICWNTRISGLIESGRPEEGILALEEMGQLWVKAAKRSAKSFEATNVSDVDGFVKPTIQNINAALAGLLRRRYDGAANRVLAWGGTLGIKPDVITFNTLLRPLARSGNTEAIQRLLVHMKEQNVQPDIATFTTILDETFMEAADMTTEEQLRTISQIFEDMEAAGVRANQITYGKIIYSLLQSPSSDMTAVTAVMRRMNEQNIMPNSYIYTSLVNRHFSRSPPELGAIRAILSRVRDHSHTVDHIFWDRVIEGYARIGDTGSALAILGSREVDNRNVGYWALTTVLEALAQNGEWELARQLVTNVNSDRGGPPPAHKKGVEGQHEFWRLVNELEIVQG